MPRKPRPTEVAETLTRLREALDPRPSAGAVATAVNATRPDLEPPLNQSSVSRYENGRLVPSDEHLTALLEHYGADLDTRERLRSVAGASRGAHRRVVSHRLDAPRHQYEFYLYEQEAVRLRSFTATIAPGLLQVDDYARAVVGAELDETRREQWLEQRGRRRALVDEPGRDLEFVIAVSALVLNRGGTGVMLAQIDHLIAASQLQHVRVGVIPSGVDIGSATALNNIDYYERAPDNRGGEKRRVVIGTSHATELLNNPTDIDHQVTVLDRLAGLAAWEGEARAELTRVRELYRT